MDVVYVWPYIEWGGVQRYFLELMKCARVEHRVSALIPCASSATLLEQLSALDVPWSGFDARLIVDAAPTMAARLRRRWALLRTTLALFRAARARASRQTVFHCDLPPWQFFALLAYLSTRSRVVVTLHTGLGRVGGLRRLMWRAKFTALCAMPGFRLVATNEDLRASLRPYLGAAAIARVPIAYSPVDANDVRTASIAPPARTAPLRAAGVPDGRFVIITPAQFIERKGPWVLLDAATRIVVNHPDVVFLWVSPAPLDAHARARVDAYGLGDRFRVFTGDQIARTRAEFLRFVGAADLFVLPSFEEGLPLALVEAMAMGVPVIASRVNAVPEAIDDGVHGLLVPAGDVNAVVAAIDRMHGDAGGRARMAAAARIRALDQFALAATARTTLAAYGA